MANIFKVMMIGDMVGQAACRAITTALPKIRNEYEADFVVVNGENAADGFGITPEIAEQVFATGANVITTGNHIWQKKEILPYLDEQKCILRPANYIQPLEGHGYCICKLKQHKLAVINLQGLQFMPTLNNPFLVIDRILEEVRLREGVSLILLDFHAESAAEKEAMGFYVDGRVSLIVGTHTHVQTADEKILPKGTGYITDLGMTGVLDSVIGSNASLSVRRFLTQLNTKIPTAEGEASICGIIAHLDVVTGHCLALNRFIYT